MKESEWFPISIKPVHKGWYHVEWEEDGISGFNWWWDGKQFLDNYMRPVICRIVAWRGMVHDEQHNEVKEPA